MNGRTELTAAITAFLNGVFGILSATGIWAVPPELIAGINGVLGPMIIYFLANRVTKVEDKADAAAVSASIAADKAAATTATVNRIDNKITGTL